MRSSSIQRETFLEPYIEHDEQIYQLEDMGLSQAPQGFRITLELQDLLVFYAILMVFPRLVFYQGTVNVSPTTPVCNCQGRLLLMGFRLLGNIQLLSWPYILKLVPLISPIPIMSVNVQKIFERFFRLYPPKFSGSINENDYDFLNNFWERLHNIDSFESHGVSYSTFQLIAMARQ